MSFIYGAPILDVSRSHTTTQHSLSLFHDQVITNMQLGGAKLHDHRPCFGPAARLLRSWVRIPPEAWIFVCCECRVLSGRGLCDELITRPEESYRLCCVVVCDLETSRISAPYIYDISSLRGNLWAPLLVALKGPPLTVHISNTVLTHFVARVPFRYKSIKMRERNSCRWYFHVT